MSDFPLHPHDWAKSDVLNKQISASKLFEDVTNALTCNILSRWPRENEEQSPSEFAESLLIQVMGVNQLTLKRARREAISGVKFEAMTNRIYEGLYGLHRVLFNEALAGRETVDLYKRRILAELGNLGSGDIYTLVCGPAPLERDYLDVIEQVVRATQRGAQFKYYFPSERFVEEASKLRENNPLFTAMPPHQELDTSHLAELRDSLAKETKGFSAFQTIFDYLADVRPAIRRIMTNLFTVAADLDRCGAPEGRPQSEEFIPSLLRNMVFRPLTFLPCSFNEKVVWVTHNGRHDIRKEILTPTDELLSVGIYAAKQEWMWVRSPMGPTALGALLRVGRELDSETKKPVDLKWNIEVPISAAWHPHALRRPKLSA